MFVPAIHIKILEYVQTLHHVFHVNALTILWVQHAKISTTAQEKIVATTEHAIYITMGIYAIVIVDLKVGTVNLLIFVLEKTGVIMETAQVE